MIFMSVNLDNLRHLRAIFGYSPQLHEDKRYK